AEAKGQAQAPKGHHAPVLRLDAGGANAVVPDLGRALIGRRGFWGQAIALDGTTEHHASFWSRSGLAAAAGRSPSLIAWVVAWLWPRRRPSLCMRLAQAGGAALAVGPPLAGAGPFSLAAPPVRRPPVARNAASPPALARPVASFQTPSPQLLAALPAAAMPGAATPPRPAATPAGPLSPEGARAIWEFIAAPAPSALHAWMAPFPGLALPRTARWGEAPARAVVPTSAPAVPTAAPAPNCGAPDTSPVAMPGPKMPKPNSDSEASTRVMAC